MLVVCIPGQAAADAPRELFAHVLPLADAQVTAETVRAYLRERMAGYKLPKEVVIVTELPREESGKIIKRKLREPYWQAASRAR